MHDDVPTVVTIDVRMTISTSMIVFQSGFFILSFEVWNLKFFVGKDNLGQLRTTFSGCREAGLTGEWKSCPQALPSHVGEGLGWGQYLFHPLCVWCGEREVSHPTPAPPLHGRGAAYVRSVKCGVFSWSVECGVWSEVRPVGARQEILHSSLPTLFTFICKGTTNIWGSQKQRGVARENMLRNRGRNVKNRN